MVYAFNGIYERAPLWYHLRRLAMHITGPWAIAGDFNCVLAATERVGGNTASTEIEPFRTCVEDCVLNIPKAIDALNTSTCGVDQRILSLQSEVLGIGLLQKKVQEMQEKLGKDPSNVQLINDEYEASNELREKYAARASFLSQKAKHQWVQQGDTNSSYFHGLLKKRRNRNTIVQIEDMNGKICNSPDQIHTAFLDYYQHLLGTSQETKKLHRKIIDQG
ncbi:uncharacterized protein LOC141595031 [Silene latifolia]|uniref:uncharacterized protein LOC141595031 n=1 Tax=Silene latifolia TaxID=37657 RepID=UPI003D771888